jgi:hypothetical protein
MQRPQACAKIRWTQLAVAGLLVVSFLLRVYGLDWDRGLLFHPDERQILMVVDRLSLPGDWRQLFHPSSPWNPRFFAYGSLPIYLLRLVSWALSWIHPAWATMSRFYLLGRIISAVFDILTVWVAYRLGSKVFDRRTGLLTAALLSFAVLHIQMSHFFTVDTLLTMVVLWAVSNAVDLSRTGSQRSLLHLSLLYGVALAIKFSALPLGLVLLVALAASAWPERELRGRFVANLKAVIRQEKRRAILALAGALITFVILQPYALIDAQRFVTGIGQEIAMSQGWYDFPYTRQYAGTLPYLYSARQIVLFALGVPLGLLGLAGLLWLAWQTWRRPSRERIVVLTWPLLYAAMQGASYAKFIRYALPLLPFLCLAGAAMWVAAWDGAQQRAPGWTKGVLAVALGGVLLSTSFYALAYLNVYRQPHAWIQASEWLCERASPGAVVLTEEWDDPLPSRGSADCRDNLTTLRLDMYAPDTGSKTDELLDALEAADWIVLSSQRLYATISRLEQRYPVSSRYYAALFGERLGFRLVIAPAEYPQLLGLTFLDDPRYGLPLETPPHLAAGQQSRFVLRLGWADESFTVYDHPQPLVFAKVAQLPRDEILRRLSP